MSKDANSPHPPDGAGGGDKTGKARVLQFPLHAGKASNDAKSSKNDSGQRPEPQSTSLAAPQDGAAQAPPIGYAPTFPPGQPNGWIYAPQGQPMMGCPPGYAYPPQAPGVYYQPQPMQTPGWMYPPQQIPTPGYPYQYPQYSQYPQGLVYNPPVQPQPQSQPPPTASSAPIELEEEDEDARLAKEEAKRRKALIAKGVSFISNAASLALILLVVFVIYSAAAGDDRGVALGPFRFFSVLTSSMEPAVSQGSVIVTVEPDERDLEKGDIVTFMPAEASATLVTHRISKVGPNPGSYITRGDANAVDDREIIFDQIIGKHVFTIPFLGLMIYPLASPLSTVWLASIAMLFVLMLWIIKKIFQDE